MKMFFSACTLFVLNVATHGLENSQLEPPHPLSGPQVVFFTPYNLTKVREGTTQPVEWYTTLPGAHHATYSFANPLVSSVKYFEQYFSLPSEESNITGNGFFNVSADFIGFNAINITIYDQYNKTLGIGELAISVILSYQLINDIFTYILYTLIAIVYINMGATIDLQVVKQIVKRPVGPAIGIFCQYMIMPLIAFSLAKIFFPGKELLQLGLFLNGASPGGGASNMWTLLLGGSLDLSIMMTFASTMVAFGAVPLWVYTMGPNIIGDNSLFKIPYKQIAIIVVSLVVPCSIGLVIQKLSPRASKFIEKNVLAKFSIFNLIFIFTFGTYSYRYVFLIFDWKILLTGFLLPALGYLSGFTIAYLCKRTWKEIIAISIETGVQNATIAIVILKFTLGAPVGELTVVMPACMVMMIPIPLLIGLIIKRLYGRMLHSGSTGFVTSTDLELSNSKKEEYENEVKTDKEMTNKIEVSVSFKKSDLEGLDNPVLNLGDESL